MCVVNSSVTLDLYLSNWQSNVCSSCCVISMIKSRLKGIFGQLVLVSVFLQTLDKCSGCIGDFQEVLCKSNCENKGTEAILQDGRRLSCSVTPPQEDSDIPRPHITNKTAVPPESFAVDCYKKFKEKLQNYYPALNIKWNQKEIDIRKGLVNGYLLIQSRSLYNISLHIEDNADTTNISQVPCITFNFNCFGVTNELLTYGERLDFIIAAVPSSQKDDNPRNEVMLRYTIPTYDECAGKTAENTTQASEIPTQAPETTTYQPQITEAEVSQKKTWMIPVLIIVILIVFVTIVLIVITVARTHIRNRKKDNNLESPQSGSNQIKQILMIADVSKNCVNGHTIATKLRDKYSIEVVTNWENSCLIHSDTVGWYKRNIQIADTVIILNGAEEVKNRKKVKEELVTNEDEFKMFIQYYFRQGISEQKETIFLVDKRDEMQFLETHNKKTCKAYLNANPEGFYEYMQMTSKQNNLQTSDQGSRMRNYFSSFKSGSKSKWKNPDKSCITSRVEETVELIQ